MASQNRRRAENVKGAFFVDETCIDCATCRYLAPDSFSARGSQSAVVSQPLGALQEEQALMALISCPTGSIGVVEPKRYASTLRKLKVSFPAPIDRFVEGSPEPGPSTVFYCGFHSEASYGAASYFIVRPEGNILVDSPRFTKALVSRIGQLGGIRFMFLTHRDDVADHRRFRDYFGCDRILHEADISLETDDVEQKLTGQEPISFAADVQLIPVPGHTRGSVVLHYTDSVGRRFLFTGDHLAFSSRQRRLTAFRNACWYSWPRQTESMARLAAFPFEWILPGHGKRGYLPSDDFESEIARLLDWMRAAA